MKKISFKKTRNLFLGLLVFVLFLWGINKVENITQSPEKVEDQSKGFVNDVTQLNLIQVENVFTPKTNLEISEIIKKSKGKISIGGARKSMGGQTATQDGMQIDMREFNKVLSFSSSTKEITVQAGARWYDIQKYIDQYGLSVMIMQSYNNFSVGGSISTNVHGRYIGYGPIIESVKSFRLVTSDGYILNVSREENKDLFYAVIGGYGAFGVIADATLLLAENTNLEKSVKKMKVEDYVNYFKENIENNKEVVFQNADIYVNNYTDANSIIWTKSQKAATEKESFMTKESSYALNRFSWFAMSEFMFGTQLRQYVLDPVLNSSESVHSRNYEASYDVSELEPANRKEDTYVLQEYFIPVNNFDIFVPKMKKVFKENEVNVLNVSIRHAKKDEGSLLAWAPKSDVFAFVIYYKQGTGVDDKLRVAKWTREMIDEILTVEGSYYLPYQEHATYEQFTRAYKNYESFFKLKQKYDPQYRFTNTLWDKYYQEYLEKNKESKFKLSTEVSTEIEKEFPFYASRSQEQTYLTLAEWYMVFSYNELAKFLQEGKPQQDFSFINSIKIFWKYFSLANRKTQKLNVEYFGMLLTIGTSYTIEYGIKSLYENTIGRLTSIVNGHETEEDIFIAKSWDRFAKSVYVEPWYEYAYWADIKQIWTETSFLKKTFIRSTERKMAVTVSYLLKAGYAQVLKKFSQSTFGVEENKTLMIVSDLNLDKYPESLSRQILVLKTLDENKKVFLVQVPRYQEFSKITIELAKHGAQFVQIMGNDKIAVSYLSDRKSESFEYFEGAEIISKEKLSDGKNTQRIILSVDVTKLSKVINILLNQGIVPEHLYDF